MKICGIINILWKIASIDKNHTSLGTLSGPTHPETNKIVSKALRFNINYRQLFIGLLCYRTVYSVSYQNTHALTSVCVLCGHY